MGKYDDIINLPHHESKRHARLSMEQRAAQFAPFAALTGYEDEVNETIRVTENKIELNDEEKEKINNKLQLIKRNIINKPKVAITYFISDIKKSGGKYVTKIGKVEKIDEYNGIIILDDKTQIQINEIIEILN